ncbi:MAG: glycine--tRNA ligase subunit beta, partial [Paraglaciecola sp.]|uniref:glycine--tRNA ligase subunit beta n=1 Tax=Paraglaciecola sp. TaxID=1920173 RepID=UPI0032973833
MRIDNLLVEIGTEELPPKSLSKLATAFKENIEQLLTESDISFKKVIWFASPRRLAVKVVDVSEYQSDKTVEKRGPAITAAFDADGTPTKAAQGWAKSNGIDVSEAQRLKTEKGEWLLFKAEVKGLPIQSIIADIVDKSLKALPIPKAMRWGSKDTQFIRPIHTFTMIYGSDLVEGSVLGIKSSRNIQGHRFHSQGYVELDTADNYISLLEQNYVMADYVQRKQKVLSAVQAIPKQENGIAVINEDLLDEVTSLVEWPVALSANFDKSFLEVPKEALIYTMKDDQKYFPLIDSNGKLKSTFVFVTNIESKDPQVIIKGNEKVIRPRLADAEFFFNTDRKVTLESRLESLKTILFQKQLGTVYEKSERIAKLAETIAVNLGLNEPKL